MLMSDLFWLQTNHLAVLCASLEEDHAEELVYYNRDPSPYLASAFFAGRSPELSGRSQVSWPRKHGSTKA